MGLSSTSKRLSTAILVISLLLLFGVYWYTGEWVLAIILIPPISHWIIEKQDNTRKKEV